MCYTLISRSLSLSLVEMCHLWLQVMCLWTHSDLPVSVHTVGSCWCVQALGAAEDETDIQAAKVARDEQKAELAEFDENIPWDEREVTAKREREEQSKVEMELALLEKEVLCHLLNTLVQ